MQNEFNNLQKEFKRIKEMGWVKQIGKGFGTIGDTFESLLGKPRDHLPLPDYHGIEIKTINENTKTNLHLFCLGPDGEGEFPIKRIVDKLGCPLKENKERKTFFCRLKCNEYTPIGKFKMGTIIVNRIKQKLEFNVLDEKKRDIGINVSWSFHSLEERLNLKLQNLALIKVKSRITNGEGYYYYHQINCFRLKGFEVFLKLVEQGIISVTFKIGVFKSGKREGQMHDYGVDFSLQLKDINLLYDKIETFI